MSKNTTSFISIITPLHNQAHLLEAYLQEVYPVMTEHYLHYEIILVDDGSTDDTRRKADAILQQYHCIRYIRLSRSFNMETAISAGLDVAIGDMVLIMRPLVDPAALIPAFINQVRKTGGVVFGLQTNQGTEGMRYRWGKKLFHRLSAHMFDFPPPPANATIYTALSRQALNAILAIKDKARYVRVFSALIGFPHDFIEYSSQHPEAAQPQKGLLSSVRSGIDILVMNSTRPLRYASYIGLVASLLNVLYIIYVFIVNLFKRNVAEGWTTLSLQNSLMFLFLFIILSVLIEYIDRMLTETKGRPSYYIAEERTSSVMILDSHRRNIVIESE
jgi:polyisoprenyl-phosphate glycosyltransferase